MPYDVRGGLIVGVLHSRADMDEHREICAADDFKKIKRGRMCKAGGDLALFSR